MAYYFYAAPQLCVPHLCAFDRVWSRLVVSCAEEPSLSSSPCLALPSSALDRPHAPRVSDGLRGEPGSSVSPLDVVCIEIEPARFFPPPPLLSRLLRADAPTNVTPAAASSTDTPEKMTDENLLYLSSRRAARDAAARGGRGRGGRASFARTRSAHKHRRTSTRAATYRARSPTHAPTRDPAPPPRAARDFTTTVTTTLDGVDGNKASSSHSAAATTTIVRRAASSLTCSCRRQRSSATSSCRAGRTRARRTWLASAPSRACRRASRRATAPQHRAADYRSSIPQHLSV